MNSYQFSILMVHLNLLLVFVADSIFFAFLATVWLLLAVSYLLQPYFKKEPV